MQINDTNPPSLTYKATSGHHTTTRNPSPTYQRLNGVTTPSNPNRHRALSVTSTSSSTSSVGTGTGRRGFNLGLNLVSSTPQNNHPSGGLSRAGSIKTPRRKLFTDQNNPIHQIIDPPVTPSNKTSSESETDDFFSSDTLGNDDLSDKFRLLATTEREILELKNSMKKLILKKREKDIELQQLKVEIEKELINNVKHEQQKLTSSPSMVQKLQLKPTGSTFNPLLDDHNSSFRPSTSAEKRQSWFSKPLNFIQQFDNMIYQEFEKLNISTAEQDKINEPIRSLADDNDVMNSVTRHLWSFVNDVKSNLLVDDEKIGAISAASQKKQRLHQTERNSTNTPNLIDLESPKRMVENTNQLTNSNNRGGIELKSASALDLHEEIDDDDLWNEEYIEI